MEEESFLAKIVHCAVFVGICTAIIVVGWREPLRYRFMSPAEILELTTPPVEAPQPTPVPPPSRLEERPLRKTH